MISRIRYITLPAVCLTFLSNALAQLAEPQVLRCPDVIATGTIGANEGGNEGGANPAERIYRLQLDGYPTRVIIDTCSERTNFDTVLELFADRQLEDLIAENNDHDRSFGCQSPRSLINEVLDDPGDYFIRLRPSPSATVRSGEFELGVLCEPDYFFDDEFGSNADDVRILYIVLGTVLPCIVICASIAFCFVYSAHRRSKMAAADMQPQHPMPAVAVAVAQPQPLREAVAQDSPSVKVVSKADPTAKPQQPEALTVEGQPDDPAFHPKKDRSAYLKKAPTAPPPPYSDTPAHPPGNLKVFVS